MPSTKISDRTAAGTLDGAEILPITQNGLDRSTTVAAITARPFSVTATGGTTARLLADRFAGMINVHDCEAVGNGVADDRQAFVDADVLTTGPIACLPGKTYLIGSNLTLTSPVFLNGGLLKPASGVTITLSSGVIADATSQLFDTTVSATSYVTMLTQTVSPCWWGVTVSGSSDSLAAWNQVVKHLNNASVTAVHFPPGSVEFSGEPTTITADNWIIQGAGGRATHLLMQSGAGTAGTFFRMGDNTNNVNNAGIHYFSVEYANASSLDGTKNVVDCVNTTDFRMSHFYADATGGVGGLVKLGDTAIGSFGKYASRTTIDHCQVLLRSVAEGTCFDLQQANVTRASYVTVSLVTLSVTKACKGIHIHPVGADSDGSRRTCDSGVWYACEFNFNLASHNIDHILVIDGSQGIPVNHWFTDCVMDHCNLAAVKLLVSAGAHVSARIADLYFTNLHCLMNGGGAILVDNTGDRDISQVEFTGGTLVGYDAAPVTFVGGTNTNDFSFNGVYFLDTENTTLKACIDALGCRSLSVVGCHAYARLAADTCKFNYFVKFIGTVERFNISGNDGDLTAGDIFGNGFLGSTRPVEKVIEHNVAPVRYQAHQITTTDATNTNLVVVPLLASTNNYIRAIVTAVKDDGTDRAMYEMVGCFYRDGSAATAQEGATANVFSPIESNAAYAATMVSSGNSVVVKGQAVAATNVNWGVTVDIRSVHE